jgi:geranylgeranyl diphosphate synthase, type II
LNKKINNFHELYEREKTKVDKKLRQVFNNRQPESLYKPAHYILEGGGKRLRPLLVLLSLKAVGGNLNKAYNASAAVELLHNFTLVHDDIMDNADKRRGRLTIHKKYDENTAILAGDALLAVAYEFLLKDCNGNSKEIISSFTKSLVEVCDGQSLDKDYETKENITIEEYLLMIRKKTAALFQMCCSIGANLGGGSRQEIKALEKYGDNLGIAFQIQDDLLDIIGNENEFGKFVGGDLVEGKKTFLFIKALSKAVGKDKEDLLRIIKNKGTSPGNIPHYKNIYLRLNIIEDAKKEIVLYTGKALASLKTIKNVDDREMLAWLADSLIQRSR